MSKIKISSETLLVLLKGIVPETMRDSKYTEEIASLERIVELQRQINELQKNLQDISFSTTNTNDV